MTFSEKVGDRPMNKRLNFGGDPRHGFMDPDTDPDTDLYRDTGKTCLGGAMLVPVLLVR